MRDIDTFPYLDLIDLLDQVFTVASQRDKLDAQHIELGEFFIGGKFRIKDKGEFNTSANAYPER